MYRIAALMLLALPLAACGDDEGTAISLNARSDDGNSTVSTDADGRLSIRAPGFEGSIKLPKIQISAEDFDVNGVKLPPGSVIQGLDVDADDRTGSDDKGTVSVTFESPVSVGEAQTWFRDNMAERNFVVQPRGTGFAGKTDDGEDFAIDLSADGDGRSKGTMTVSGQ